MDLHQAEILLSSSCVLLAKDPFLVHPDQAYSCLPPLTQVGMEEGRAEGGPIDETPLPTQWAE